ncbi:hypothetical protein EMPS_10800 [Entomortierella parvispora]|uniref:Transmembrane protein n=1 Tax=Entomortierella parvispora TaxID=205924 RepID=A0A9P3HKU4_9FUNG|nr:hypothetical protein EMPS_10800 [Entomortierella parvispora]
MAPFQNPVLHISLAILCATAVLTLIVYPSLDVADDSGVDALTGPVQSRWVDPSHRCPEQKDKQEEIWQQERVAFRQFSEKMVSAHCTGVLGSTLDLLDNIRDSVHDRLQAKESFDFMDPVLAPLTPSLKMADDYHYSVELTEEELQEEKKRDEDEEEEQRRNPALYLSPREKELEERIRGFNRQSNTRMRSWTEENEPQLLLKFRLRLLEKTMAVFPYVLRFAPDPVRQELEESGFVQQTKALREQVRSLLTCEGVPHITVAQLKDEMGERGSDNHMDRSSATTAISLYYIHYRARLLLQSMHSHAAPMVPLIPTWGKNCEILNVTRAVDHELVKGGLDNRQQLKDQSAEDTVLFKTPETEFVWTWEAIVQLSNATDGNDDRKLNPEIAALMFQE